MLPPLADRPPPSTAATDSRLTALIGKASEVARFLAFEEGFHPYRVNPSTNHPVRMRPFDQLTNVRFIVDRRNRVTEVLVPRSLTVAEKQSAEDNVRTLEVAIEVHTRKLYGPILDYATSVLTDAYLLRFPAYCPTKAKVSTFFTHHFRVSARRLLRHYVFGIEDNTKLTTMPSPLLDGVSEKVRRTIPEAMDATKMKATFWPTSRPRDVDIVIQRFGLGNNQPTCLSRIANQHHLSRERVRGIVIEMLAAAREKAELAGFRSEL